MPLTPEDVERQTFKERFKGYDMDEVDSFLDRVVARLHELSEERAALRRKLDEASTSTGESERLLQRTLLTAQRTADQTVEEAQEQADRILTEAREEALQERLRLQAESEQLVHAIDELRRFRARYVGEVRSVIEEQLASLERTSMLPEIPEEVEELATDVQRRTETDVEAEGPAQPSVAQGSSEDSERGDVPANRDAVDLPPTDPVGPSALDTQPTDDPTADSRAGE